MPRRPGKSAVELLAVDSGGLLSTRAWPTGFRRLDRDLGGGLHAGELTLIAGAPGMGKTTLALQMARNIALGGDDVVYLCYEHSETELLTRLLLLESGIAHPQEPPLTRRASGSDISGAAEQLLASTVAAVQVYGERLRFIRGVGSGADAQRELPLAGADGSVVFVDYLQKVPSRTPDAPADEQVAEIVVRLKDFALATDSPVVALVASDRSGLDGSRLRIGDLRGSTALVYEADVVLILNDKHRIVARHHLMYGSPEAVRFNEFVVCTIEKNRSGRAPLDLEVRKHFSHGCFDSELSPVAEQLVDGRVFIE